MSLADEYARQFAWRPWPEILGALPPLRGSTVFDLGCGAGDLAAELSGRGARVVGFDLDEGLLEAARSRSLRDAEFRRGDFRTLRVDGPAADGIWSSFAAAYVPDLAPVLEAWGRLLRPGGWIALTEVDDLFGHEPLDARAKQLFDTYAREAFEAGRYDFHMGGKLRSHLEQAGFSVSREMTVRDLELSFDGPARAGVLEAWGRRFERMGLLRRHCGAAFETTRDAFLACLSRDDHRSRASVRCCIARALSS